MQNLIYFSKNNLDLSRQIQLEAGESYSAGLQVL